MNEITQWLSDNQLWAKVLLGVHCFLSAHVLAYMLNAYGLRKTDEEGRNIVRYVCCWFIYWPVYVPLRALWRWWKGRRARIKSWETTASQLARAINNAADSGYNAYARDGVVMIVPKPAPDRQYQGDQVTGLRKDILALEERVGKLEVAHYSLDWIVAQQMRDPHFEPVGTLPVEGDIVYNPDKRRYDVVESVSDEVYLDNGGSYHCWAFMSPAVVPDDMFGGEQRPRVLRRKPQ